MAATAEAGNHWDGSMPRWLSGGSGGGDGDSGGGDGGGDGGGEGGVGWRRKADAMAAVVSSAAIAAAAVTGSGGGGEGGGGGGGCGAENGSGADLQNLPKELVSGTPKNFLRSVKDDEKRRKLMKNAEKFSSPQVFSVVS